MSTSDDGTGPSATPGTAPPDPVPTGPGEAAYGVLSRVRPLYQASARAVDEALRGTGVTTPLRAVLELLLTQGPLTVPQVAREFGVARQSVQVLVDAGTARGLLATSDNPHHRRSRLVAVTALGEGTFTDLHRREIANLDSVTVDLDPDELARCAHVLAVLTERVRRLPHHDQELA